MKEWVLITGASSGIGEGLALEWAKRKTHYLIVAARSLDRLQTLAKSCSEYSETLAVSLDLESPDSVAFFVARLKELKIIPKVVVHNAGISQRSLVVDTELAVVRRLMEVNYFGTIHLTLKLLPLMIENQGGTFIVVTSLVGKFGSPLRSAYSASKHALHGYFDSLRAELGGKGIRVMMVCPGFIKTAISKNALTAQGAPQGTMDEAQAGGMSPEVFSRRLIRAYENHREEVYIGGREVFGVYLKRWIPKVFSWMIARAKVT